MVNRWPLGGGRAGRRRRRGVRAVREAHGNRMGTARNSMRADGDDRRIASARARERAAGTRGGGSL